MKNNNTLVSIDNTKRFEVFTKIFEYLKSIYGEENVSRVGNVELSINIGTAYNGNEIDVNLAPVVKTYWNDSPENPAYNRRKAEADYVKYIKEKEEMAKAKKIGEIKRLKERIERLEKSLNEIKDFD